MRKLPQSTGWSIGGGMLLGSAFGGTLCMSCVIRTVRFVSAITTLWLTIAACSDATAPAIHQRVRVLPAWVTGEAAAAVDPLTAQFTFSENFRVVSRAQAETIALAVDRFLSDPNLLGNGVTMAQQDRGAPIDFGALRLCERATYSVSPVANFPPEIPAFVRRAFASHWAIPLCGRDGAVHLSVGVPDAPMDIRVVNGSLVFGQSGGEDFDYTGVPPRFPFGLPVTPEEAVAAVVNVTGRRVARVPVAFNQYEDGFGELPLCASWRLFLDEPAVMRDAITGDTVVVQEIFVHHAPACFSSSLVFDVPSLKPAPPRWIYIPEQGSPAGYDSVEVSYSGPAAFRRVQPVGLPPAY